MWEILSLQDRSLVRTDFIQARNKLDRVKLLAQWQATVSLPYHHHQHQHQHPFSTINFAQNRLANNVEVEGP